MVKADTQVMVASTAFIGAVGKTIVTVRTGDLFSSDDPAVKKWPQHFRPVSVRSSGARIEQATAAPGEKRGA